MNEYDLTGKFGWYIALGICVLASAMNLWFILNKPNDAEPKSIASEDFPTSDAKKQH